MPSTFCPECDTEIQFDVSPKEGDHVTCPTCGAYLNVINVSPIELDWVFEDEDFGDDFEDD